MKKKAVEVLFTINPPKKDRKLYFEKKNSRVPRMFRLREIAELLPLDFDGSTPSYERVTATPWGVALDHCIIRIGVPFITKDTSYSDIYSVDGDFLFRVKDAKSRGPAGNNFVFLFSDESSARGIRVDVRARGGHVLLEFYTLGETSIGVAADWIILSRGDVTKVVDSITGETTDMTDESFVWRHRLVTGRGKTAILAHRGYPGYRPLETLGGPYFDSIVAVTGPHLAPCGESIHSESDEELLATRSTKNIHQVFTSSRLITWDIRSLKCTQNRHPEFQEHVEHAPGPIKCILLSGGIVLMYLARDHWSFFDGKLFRRVQHVENGTTLSEYEILNSVDGHRLYARRRSDNVHVILAIEPPSLLELCAHSCALLGKEIIAPLECQERIDAYSLDPFN